MRCEPALPASDVSARPDSTTAASLSTTAGGKCSSVYRATMCFDPAAGGGSIAIGRAPGETIFVKHFVLDERDASRSTPTICCEGAAQEPDNED